MAIKIPDIDSRSAADIAGQVKDLLTVYAPEWKEFDPATGKPEGMSAALINIFARYCEIVIQRLNKAPEKNFLAFLDLLGASLQPPQPARVPLTFSLAAGSTGVAVVPAGTQAAAPPAEGEKDPVIFETERELVVTPAQLASVFTRDPEQDLFADLSAVIASPATPAVPAFRGDRRNEHIVYFGHDKLLGFTHISNLSLLFDLDTALGDDGALEWELWNGTEWAKVTTADTLSLAGNKTLVFGGIAPVPLTSIDSLENRWLRCRLSTPITRSTDPLQGMVRESLLPGVKQVELAVQLLRPVSEGLLPEMSFVNSLLIEPGKDFYPFGEKPKLNDSLCLASAEAFSKDRAGNLASTGATISLEVSVANSHLLPVSVPVRPSGDGQLAWECWNGNTWQRVGTSSAPDWLSLIEIDAVPSITTESSVVVQGTAQRGSSVTLEYGTPNSKTTITAIVGEDGRFAAKVEPLSDGINVISFIVNYKSRTAKAWAVIVKGTAANQLTVTMPQLPVAEESVSLTVSSTEATLQSVKVTNGRDKNWIREQPAGTDLQILLAKGRNELLIEGLNAAQGLVAAATVMISREAERAPAPDATTGFADGTYAFSQSGTVTLRLPDTVQKALVSGQEQYWLRTRLVNGDYGKEAAYRLKNPLVPEDGFTLVLATFRPPLVSSIKIGYEQTLRGVPEYCLAYNNLEYENVTEDNKAKDRLFRLFKPAPDERPTLYYGFTLPSVNMSFPNRSVSLYNRLAERKYRELSVPISPELSSAGGANGSDVMHSFSVENTASIRQNFNIECAGTIWPSRVGAPQVTLDPGESKNITMTVSIPGAPAKGSDAGRLRITPAEDPGVVYNAAFVTFSGAASSSSERPRLAWEYWNGSAWGEMSVRDNSENFTRPGLLEFLPPKDFTLRRDFGLERYWVRAQWKSGEYPYSPKLQRVLLNTTIASQTVTIKNEILGSSDQSERQPFRTTRKPVLDGQQLAVREPEMPTADDQTIIKSDEGEDAIAVGPDAAGRPKEIWVRWHEVPDFYGSGPRDRHYVIDHIGGEIAFGDGLNGMIPPRGAGNVTMKQYQTGGGAKGNKPAGAIIQLKTTVPYVEKVINADAAAGGADAETTDSLYQRAPRSIRHRGRSVTAEDYEDLAMLASPEVARALCVPLRNLAADPGGNTMMPGEITVIIVPRSTDAKPLPSLELIGRVQEYLIDQGVPTANVSVVGPQYLRVDVSVEIGLVSLEGANAVEQAVRSKLAEFLHPLTGGLDGKGWNFGREPHRSDFYALIEAVPGVDHTNFLKLDDTGDDPAGVIKKTGRFLVYSGNHTISLVYE